MTLPFSRRPTHEAAPAGLVRMRVVATGLLVLMAVTYALARWQEPAHPAFGFVRAFAEAAMVGGLADWFAVTALFRHPLGLPIPHTAIVPRNKDRIGETLASFLRNNFLVPAVVARRMRRLDIASAAGRWLAQPPGGPGRLRRGASRLVAEMLQAFDQDRLGGLVKSTVAQRLRQMEVAPLIGQALTAAIAENRHVPLLDGIVRWAGRVLAANDHLIRAMVHERAGSIMRWTGLDETLSNKLIDGLDQLLADMADDPHHPLRDKAEEGLAVLAHDLQHDATMRLRVEALKLDLLDNPAMQRWIDGMWEQMRGGMLKIARDPDAAMAGRLGEMLRELGEPLQHDPKLRRTINRFVRRAAVGAAADYGDAIVRLVSDTVRGWDTGTITRRLENAVGRDLQYIRINGTIVGGLVGLLIHLVDVGI
ncbi:conserved hypothetical protein [Sphingomonas sp. EC-HK361]|uniref:DUF445 domain-containing protein n=1 Tax=Sphingomonas sp. EC-HK361 TaxID=2038397 RepID=UPI001259A45F|nr:DUF445 domain-containing protein [Sphingomonas sp. EC-HK361]VVT15253.1 conserved hypothetical protein [Sphingomonas sp. EC-HK361]